MTLLSACEAARRLGIATTSLYQWLGDSDAGTFRIRGEFVRIAYFQGGPQGQGRIRIETNEVERLLDLMRSRPVSRLPRQPAIRRDSFPGISVRLGRP